MRLTKLELQGFKSFADDTELLFEPGVTAIVGPNGCGKSNVSDAVRWVLGEQRARALRGAKMEEVIFQGSSARRPVNIAEVSLHFENDDGALGVPFREVVITRRLSRSGESEYLLNRSPCRLRDIHDMVRGTGLGADSGVVIESKMIDALLSDRPDERRELFEEAAGVGLYRDRKRSTERRLEETAVDLGRLDDLISEVQTQVRSLSRQRRRAEKHGELIRRRYVVEIALAAREMDEWREELQRLEQRVQQLRTDVPAMEESVAASEAARDTAHGARAAAEGRRAELARLVAEQRETTQQLRGEIAVAEERQRNALARRERAEQERREGDTTVERVTEDLDRAVAHRKQLESELAVTSDSLKADVAEEEAVRRALAEARGEVDAAERSVRELRESAHRHELDRQAAERELDELTAKRDALLEERAQLADSEAAVRRELKENEDALTVARDRSSILNAELAAALAAVRTAREEDSAARSALLRSEEAQTALAGKLSALEGLERERVGLAPAAAKLLREKDRFGDGAVLGPLSDFISSDSESASLVERFLGATVHAVLVRDRSTAEAIRTWHAATHPGPLLLLPVDADLSSSIYGEPDASTEGAVASDLAELVRSDSSAGAWVRALLGRVTSIESGTAFVDSRGAVWLPANIAGPGPLRRRAEIYESKRELSLAERTRGEAARNAEIRRNQLNAAEAAAAMAQEAAHAASRTAAEREDLLTAATRRHHRALKEAGDANAMLERLEARETALSETIARIQSTIADSNSNAVSFDSAVSDARRALVETEARQDAAREQRTASEVAAAQAQARLQVASDRERHLREEQNSASARLASLQSELSTLSAADSELAEQLAGWQLDLEAKQATLEDIETRLANAELTVRSTDAQLDTAEHALNEIRHRSSQLLEELHSGELRLTELSGRRAAIRERLETEWRKPLDELMQNAEPVDADDETLRTEATQLRDQLDALGPVNPLAIEEHDEEQKRLEMLTTQRADLASAKLSLQQAIREIDTTARELFLTTFVQVRENFRKIFMTLFGGGECDLRLENSDSPLDGDIEIHAAPRGKRTQRIHLLSSGERALVALSLLFGIFLTKPSPFCLLDEVDAPLDDANIGRFVRMLTEFKNNTQFIVITHNPRTTTEAADAVYGVTMQEPGVSSLVSVHMRGAAVEEAIAGTLSSPEPAAAMSV
ncbi:MAG TPA: chromosome segregation protein SMC [Gemmatimonadaceae bacterium]|nr:chromosome segregation protein SMC [Gemmatimonadaceae bacterium]